MRSAPGSFPIFKSSDEPHIQETDTVYGDLEIDGLRPLISNRLIAETRYQHGTPQDTGGRNFILKRDLTRYYKVVRNCL